MNKHNCKGQSEERNRIDLVVETVVSFSAELYDAHACGKEDVALQATRTRRSGSLCEP